ncbi:MAG TPA: RNA polymerase sigma factor [Polyangia bacterium]|nr:RNA polymerase sigma factor [Polyangia bacterium]
MVNLRAVPMPLPPERRSDAALVAAARAGEGWAAEALFRRHAPVANGLALRLLGRDADVDDLVQDSFASALTTLGRLREPQAFEAWLCSILVRTAAKVIRRRRLLARLGLGRASLAIDVDALVAPGAPPDEALELRRLYALAQELPAAIRVPLLLRRVEGLGLDEISRLTRTSTATVKRRIGEGEERLRARFLGGRAP